MLEVTTLKDFYHRDRINIISGRKKKKQTGSKNEKNKVSKRLNQVLFLFMKCLT